MQSYIVRVYRRNTDNKDEVAGIIEKVGSRHQTSFSNLSGFQESFEHLINSDDLEESQIDYVASVDLICASNSPE